MAIPPVFAEGIFCRPGQSRGPEGRGEGVAVGRTAKSQLW